MLLYLQISDQRLRISYVETDIQYQLKQDAFITQQYLELFRVAEILHIYKIAVVTIIRIWPNYRTYLCKRTCPYKGIV